MISKERYKKTLTRIWDSVRTDDEHKNNYNCMGVKCKECPVASVCGNSVEIAYELIEFVEQWAKEHPIETNGSRFLRNFPKAEVHGCNYDDKLIYIKLNSNTSDSDKDIIKFPTIWWVREVDDADCD